MGLVDLPRVIPILLISEGKLVKTVSFSSPAYLGDPINAVRILNGKEADELIVLDVSASARAEPPDFRMIERLATEAFMPLTYGGGIRSADDVDVALSLGIEKIAVESLTLTMPGEVRRASEWFGAQAVVGILTTTGQGSAIRPMWPGEGDSLESRLRHMVDCKAGEILHYDADRDGTRRGYNVAAIRKITSEVSIPVIAAGGAGSFADFVEAIRSGASAVAAGSLFSQHGKRLATLISYPQRQILDELFEDLDSPDVEDPKGAGRNY